MKADDDKLYRLLAALKKSSVTYQHILGGSASQTNDNHPACWGASVVVLQ